MLVWVPNFLTDRFQRVKVNERSSSWQPVLSGVPQGSVLGPLLFCMFIDSLHSLCDNSVTYKYADDVNIVHFIRKVEEDNLQLEFDNVLEWSFNYHLPINQAKCSVMDIITKKSIVCSPLTSSSGMLPRVSSLRILGVTISDNLRWNNHIESVLKRSNKRVYLIRNLKRAACPPPAMLLAYNSIIRPLLLYAYPCFCNLPAYLQERLLKFERRIFRIIGAKNDISVIEAGDQFCQKLFDKVSRSNSHCLRRCFSQQLTNTRQSLKLRPIRSRTSRLSRSFIRFAK